MATAPCPARGRPACRSTSPAGCCDGPARPEPTSIPAPILTPVLTLDATGDGCTAGVVRDGVVLAERLYAGGRGSAAVLPALAEAALREAGLRLAELSALVVTVGPGSFTGVRAALALAHGIALGTGLPLRGVLATAAIRAAVQATQGAAEGGGVPIWVATASRRGRVFLDTGATVLSLALGDVQPPPGRVLLAGDAAAALLPLLGPLATPVPVERPAPAGIAAAPPVPAVPFYIDPPEARPGPAPRPFPTWPPLP